MLMVGTCGLCLQQKELQNSHLLPAALYKQSRDPSAWSNPNPVLVTNGRAFTSSQQVSSPFLCADCESRFSVNGENYVVTQCAKLDGSFSLRKLLQTVSPFLEDKEKQIALYDVHRLLGAKVDHYLYFATSVFWRASAHSWRMGDGQVGKIALGEKYQEQFRLYLLGEDTFPQNARIHVHVSSETHLPLTLTTGPTTFRIGSAHRHKFYIPGVLFVLFLGSKVSKTHHMFALNSRKQQTMWLCPWQNDSLFRGILKHLETAIPVGKLGKGKG
ncbi:MAG: hypothetical protein IPM58_07330 [Nitrospira sp.]|nr:hypothetical protein [Nitrospira sp.]